MPALGLRSTVVYPVALLIVLPVRSSMSSSSITPLPAPAVSSSPTIHTRSVPSTPSVGMTGLSCGLSGAKCISLTVASGYMAIHALTSNSTRSALISPCLPRQMMLLPRLHGAYCLTIMCSPHYMLSMMSRSCVMCAMRGLPASSVFHAA